jgi:hypothetical protein
VAWQGLEANKNGAGHHKLPPTSGVFHAQTVVLPPWAGS